MKKYLINEDTYAVIATYTGSKIITKDSTYNVDKKVKIIVNESCRYYGSSLDGRLCGTKTMLGISYKAPIIVSEFKKIIMFPTASIRNESCSWINLCAIKKYVSKSKDVMLITFKNDESILLKLSFGVLDKQILRASRLESVFLARKM